MLTCTYFTFNPFQENTYVLYDETGECLIIDPGCYEEQELQTLTDFIRAENLRVQSIINTHCHIDHVLGNQFVKEYFKVDLYIHAIEEAPLRAVSSYASNYGFFKYQPALPDHFLKEGDIVKVGEQELKVLFVPGHSPGHIALYNESHKMVMGGDVLFYNSIGRTDLPGGDTNTLLNSIRTHLFTLPDDVKVYPGHGPETTIGFEKANNPFLKA